MSEGPRLFRPPDEDEEGPEPERAVAELKARLTVGTVLRVTFRDGRPRSETCEVILVTRTKVFFARHANLPWPNPPELKTIPGGFAIVDAQGTVIRSFAWEPGPRPILFDPEHPPREPEE